MSPAAQVVFESVQCKSALLAVFVRYSDPVGAGTEQAGLNCARFFGGLVSDVEAGPWSICYTAKGSVVFLNVTDARRALSEVWGAFSRFGCEDTSWIAEHQTDGTWLDLFPERGAVRALPAEIILLPHRIYVLEAELKQLHEKQGEINADYERRREQLENGRVIDAVVGDGDEHEARLASVNERVEAVRAELAGWRAKLTGGQS